MNRILPPLMSNTVSTVVCVAVCMSALFISGCQSQSSSSSSSSQQSSPPQPSTSTPSPSTSSPSTPSTSAPSSSSASSSSSSQSASSSSQGGPQSPSSGQESNGSGSGYEESGYEDVTSNGSGQGTSGDVLSQEEAVAVLDGQFDESIAVFDGMIIGERAAAQAGQEAFPEEDGGYGDDEPLFEEADITEDSDSSGSPTNGQGENQGMYSDGGGDGTPGDTASSSNNSRSGGVKTNLPGGPVPSDIPDGRDDDIVARQIREAAMKEQDPVLREKLWEEYRKYKKGQ